MKIEKLLNELLQKNVFVVIKKHSLAASLFNFIIMLITGFCAIKAYFAEPFSQMFFAGMITISIIYAYNLVCGIDHLQLVIPKAGKPLKLYKVGDAFFVGCSMEEAQLFAALANKQEVFIEEFENSVYTFE